MLDGPQFRAAAGAPSGSCRFLDDDLADEPDPSVARMVRVRMQARAVPTLSTAIEFCLEINCGAVYLDDRATALQRLLQMLGRLEIARSDDNAVDLLL